VPTGEGTAADAELIYRLSLLDVRVTVRQIQGWRRLGIMNSPEIVRRGRNGTEALSYPPGTEVQVAAIVRMLDVHRDIDLVVLGLFGVGVNPTEVALRKAYEHFQDESEAHDLRSKSLSDAGSTHFSKRVNVYAAAIRKDLPEIVNRWNADARSRARAESQVVDRGTGKPERVTTKEIRERDIEEFILATLGEKGGDASAMLRAFGMREERVAAALHEDGGVPTYAERRAALDGAELLTLIAIRDLVRRSWDEFVADEMPDTFGAFMRPLFDLPEVGGLMTAVAVESTLVYLVREGKVVPKVR
jgi:hypothetical protein